MKMEFYSRDKIYVRVITTLAFIALVIVGIYYFYFANGNSLLEHLNHKYFMSPHYAIFIVYIVYMFMMFIYTIVQIEPAKYGIKKRVNDRYMLFPAITFLFLALNTHFIMNSMFKTATLAAFMSLANAIIVYIRADSIKTYMYDDELRTFVKPFAVAVSWNIILVFMSANMTFQSAGAYASTAFKVTMCFLQLLIIILVSTVGLKIFSDKIFSYVLILYMIAVTVSTFLDGYFMPIGYAYFLAVIVVCVIFYKNEKAKKNK